MQTDTRSNRQIRKRDGVTLQQFDDSKIANAVRGAWGDTGKVADELAIATVTMQVVSAVSDMEVIDVETVQDCVEVALMHHKLFDVAKAFIIYRQKRAEARTARRQPDPKAVSGYIHASKYARYLPFARRREVYEETVERVEKMHLRRFGHIPGMNERIRGAFDLVREQRVLPSMRSMQFGGAAIEQNNNRIYNCSATHIDRIRAFSEGFFLLLSGCGVGYSVQFKHVDKLPEFKFVDEKRVVHHTVADSIEGWADAALALFQSFVDGTCIEFDYHNVRKEGATLKTSGGKAPGHLPLKRALEAVRAILLGAQGRRLRPVEAHRIMCLFADAVLSGGIRRSAMIALFSLEDSEMMYLKTGDWFKREPWLANANNSVVLKRDDVKQSQFMRIFQMTKQFGEPGFVFVADEEETRNPCVPGHTRILTRRGYVTIESLVGQTVEVWNGEEWSSVQPRVTGRDQAMVRVHLSDGTYLDCTDYHEWCVATGFRHGAEERVKAVDLKIGDALSKYDMPVIETGVKFDNAYAHGFFCGDGVVESKNIKSAMLYGIKKELLPYLNAQRSSTHPSADRIRAVLPIGIPDKFEVPFWADVRGRLDWLAGLLDSDGTVICNPNSVGLQITSVNKKFLLDVRLLLTTLGVQAKINYMSEGGLRLLPDGRGGKREFVTQEAYRLLVNAEDTHRLVRLGLTVHRLDLSLAEEKPQRDARRFVTVEAVERIEPAEVVYCFTEPKNHTGTFEGVVTAQCAEISLNCRLFITYEVMKILKDRAKRGKPMPDVKMGEVYTGFAFCNLCELNAAKFTSFEDFLAAAEAATLIGTLQASYTDMPYLGWVSEVIAEREALLGIGMTGMMDAPHIANNPDYQRQVAERVVELNAEIAEIIGIRPAARATTVKPSGTTSLAVGCVGSGQHPHHARRYIRTVTANELEAVFQHFKGVNPHMCVMKPDGDWIVEFPVEAPEGALIKADFGAIDFLEIVRSTQRHWVATGTARPESSPGYVHNVSNTVHVKLEEWPVVADYLWVNRADFAGVSFIPNDDTVYAFAPFQAVVTEADEARWNQLVAHYKPVDYEAMIEEEDGTNVAQEPACANGACEIPR